MIFFRGWMGLVVLFYIAIVVAVGVAALPRSSGDLIAGAALLVAAPVVWLLGRRANGTPTESGIWKIFDDSILSLAGRQAAEQKSARQHSLMFVRVEYWSLFVAASGLAMLLVRPGARGLFD
jgi:hypothetical protein